MQLGKVIFSFYRLPKQPTITRQIHGQVLKDQLPLATAEFHVADPKYDLISFKDMKEIVKLNRFSEMTYTVRTRDCDDYSFALMGLVRKLLPGVAFGIVWVDILDTVTGKLKGKHALNFFVDDKYNTYFVEPQSNRIFRKPEAFRPYFVVI